MEQTKHKLGMSDLMRTAEVAGELRVSPNRVRQLDDLLRPVLTTNGERLFTRARVEEVKLLRAERAAARAAKRKPRATTATTADTTDTADTDK